MGKFVDGIEIEDLDFAIIGDRIKRPTASLQKILKDTNVYKIIASTASCYELSNDLFPKREGVDQNKEEFKNSFFVSSVGKVAKYHESLKDSYPEQTTSIVEKLAKDFMQFVKKSATGSSEDDIEVQYAVKLIIDLRKYTTNLIEELISDNKELKTKLSNGGFFYLFDYPKQGDLDIYLRFEERIDRAIQVINNIYENDYEPAEFKKYLLMVFAKIKDVFGEFCNNSKTFVEKVLEKDAIQIQKNIEEEQKKIWEKDNPKLCANIVTDFSEPEKYPHTASEYKKLCDAFNRFDCKQYYESDPDSLEMVQKICDQNTHHTDL